MKTRDNINKEVRISERGIQKTELTWLANWIKKGRGIRVEEEWLSNLWLWTLGKLWHTHGDRRYKRRKLFVGCSSICNMLSLRCLGNMRPAMASMQPSKQVWVLTVTWSVNKSLWVASKWPLVKTMHVNINALRESWLTAYSLQNVNTII